jgi:mono/diheme cytochrome c family protein
MASHAFLDDQQIADVLTFIRNYWGNEAEAITAEEVAALRKEQ